MTSDPSVSVFVKFFTTWCSHCKAVESIWQELGQYFLSQEDNVVIAQIDMTANYLENVKVLRQSVIPLFFYQLQNCYTVGCRLSQLPSLQVWWWRIGLYRSERS